MSIVASGDFGPAPDGVNLADDEANKVFAGVISLVVISTLVVAVRLVARSVKAGSKLTIDDYIIVAALVRMLFVYRDISKVVMIDHV